MPLLYLRCASLEVVRVRMDQARCMIRMQYRLDGFLKCQRFACIRILEQRAGRRHGPWLLLVDIKWCTELWRTTFGWAWMEPLFAANCMPVWYKTSTMDSHVVARSIRSCRPIPAGRHKISSFFSISSTLRVYQKLGDKPEPSLQNEKHISTTPSCMMWAGSTMYLPPQ